MDHIEQQILHHHAIALDWLCNEMEDLTGIPADHWRKKALKQGILEWEAQTPEELLVSLNRNLAVLQEVFVEPNDPRGDIDSVVLWDEEHGPITESQLTAIVKEERDKRRSP